MIYVDDKLYPYNYVMPVPFFQHNKDEDSLNNFGEIKLSLCFTNNKQNFSNYIFAIDIMTQIN